MPWETFRKRQGMRMRELAVRPTLPQDPAQLLHQGGLKQQLAKKYCSWSCGRCMYIYTDTNVPDLTRQIKVIIIIKFISLSLLLESKFLRKKESSLPCLPSHSYNPEDYLVHSKYLINIYQINRWLLQPRLLSR